MQDRLRRGALLAALVAIAIASPARAQLTGGSAGSSGFGGGGGGGGTGGSAGSSSGWGSSSGSSRRSSAPAEPTNAATYTPLAAERGEPFLPAHAPEVTQVEREARGAATGVGLFFASGCGTYLLVTAALAALAWLLTRPKDGAAATARRGGWEVRRLSIAFDWTARARLQRAIDEITRTTSIASDAGRAVLLARVAVLMQESLPAARYATFQSFVVPAAGAEPRFVQSAADLRARFQKETRGARATEPAPELRARAVEGEGLVVVSVVGAFDRALPPLPRGVDAASLAAALRALGDAPRGRRRVVAIEVVWSPAEDQDRLSSAELERVYPELLRVDAAATDVGRVACAHCSAVFPAELGKCPACGAPVA